ncbi:MAG: hypothetical protein N2379_11145 [Verrucomicrobiae bacterium]|nr:hypothetical protein [Verrucomicrobiae bacterium]
MWPETGYRSALKRMGHLPAKPKIRGVEMFVVHASACAQYEQIRHLRVFRFRAVSPILLTHFLQRAAIR